MTIQTPIQPFIVTTSNTVTSFTVSCRTLVLFTSATFTVDSFDVNESLINRQVVPINTEQYLEWNNNDSFIIDLMATICGYTLASPTPSSSTQQVVTPDIPTITPPNINGP